MRFKSELKITDSFDCDSINSTHRLFIHDIKNKVKGTYSQNTLLLAKK